MIPKRTFLGLLGFLSGLSALTYFSTGDATQLYFLVCFSFCHNFILARIGGDRADERFVLHQHEAGFFAMQVGSGMFPGIALLGFLLTHFGLSIFGYPTFDVVFGLLCACYSLIWIIYALKLYLLEER